MVTPILAGLIKRFQLLNLDVVVGAILNSIFFAVCLRSKITWFTILVLAITVWIIYTGDRLLDTRKSVPVPETSRHKFHGKNRKGLIFTIVVLMVVVVVVLPLLPLATVAYGVGLVLVVLCYFTFLMLLKPSMFLKEPVIAVLYTCGVALPAVSLGVLGGNAIFILLQHTTMAFLNLLLISYYEADIDARSGHYSLAVGLGAKGVEKLLCTVLWILLISMVGYLILYPGKFSFLIQSTFLSMWIVFFLIKSFTSYFSRNDRYRTWADMAFWIPGWIIWV